LTPVWTLRFDGGVLYPLIVHGMAIVSIAGPQPNLRAVDLNTGALRWGPLATGQPVQLAYGNGAVFALDGTGNLTAFDVSTGARLWSTRIDALLAGFGPVFSNGLVYVNGVGGGGVTYAFNARDGKLVWTALTGAGSAGAVAVGGGIVYEAEGCHTVFAFDAATGQLTWTAGSDCGMGATPSVYQDAIYATDTGSTALFGLGGEQRGSLAAATRPAFHAGTAFFLGIGMNPSPTLFAQDIATGAVKWSFASDLFLCSSPVVAGAGGQVFIASASGNLYELDEATGAVRSVTKAAASLECEDGNLTLGAGRLLVIAPNQLIAY
jgi:outer membrane protein assembly factor BamB